MIKRHLGLTLLLLASLSQSTNAVTVFAQTGFNDASGINADASPNSPYTVGGTIESRGQTESGWADIWHTSIGGVYNGASIASVENWDTVEGDGALYLRHDTGTGYQGWAYRQWSVPQINVFTIEQYVKLPAGGTFISRPFGAGVPGGIGPNWQITGNHFEVKDGNDPNQPYENTGIPALADTWYKVAEIVDVPHQTYQFYVNDVRYNAPDSLGFEGNPTYIDHIDYLASSGAYIDALRITVAPRACLPRPDVHRLGLRHGLPPASTSLVITLKGLTPPPSD